MFAEFGIGPPEALLCAGIAGVLILGGSFALLLALVRKQNQGAAGGSRRRLSMPAPGAPTKSIRHRVVTHGVGLALLGLAAYLGWTATAGFGTRWGARAALAGALQEWQLGRRIGEAPSLRSNVASVEDYCWAMNYSLAAYSLGATQPTPGKSNSFDTHVVLTFEQYGGGYRQVSQTFTAEWHSLSRWAITGMTRAEHVPGNIRQR